MEPLVLMAALLIVLIFLRIPIAFAMGIASLAYLLYIGANLSLIAQYLVVNMDSFTLLAIPFFMLAGELMVRGGIADRLVAVAVTLVGHIRGGLGHVNIVVACIFATMSGSASADAAAAARILVPAMERAGYSRGYAAALTAAGATIGPILPPSIALVLLGAINGLSVSRLFLSGIVPGLLLVVGFMALVFTGIGRREVAVAPRATLKQVVSAFRYAALSFTMPAIILGGIFGGYFTPTEAAAVAVLYAFVLGKFIYRSLTWADLIEGLVGAMNLAARVLFIVALAGVFGWILTYEQAGTSLTREVSSFASSAWVLLILLNLLLLFLGMFINETTLLVLLSPLIYPLIKQYGIDPYHFSVVFVLNMMVGQLHPPVGILSFIVVSIAKCRMEDFLKAVWPMILIHLIVLILITFVPSLVLWLPNRLLGG